MTLNDFNGASQKWILVALGVVATIGVIGSVTSADRSTEILAFCSLIAVSLLGLLQQIRTTDRLTHTTNELKELKVVAKDTHTLVNSNMGIQLRLNSELSRWKANETKGKPGYERNLEAAERAEALYAEHEAKQNIVDDK